MRDINKVILVGRLGADPIQRTTQSGVAVTRLSVATSRRVKTQSGDSNFSEETQWHHVVVWGREAEYCSKYLKKGQRILIDGSVRIRKYIDKEGIERISYEIHSDNIGFLSPPKKENVFDQNSESPSQPMIN